MSEQQCLADKTIFGDWEPVKASVVNGNTFRMNFRFFNATHPTYEPWCYYPTFADFARDITENGFYVVYEGGRPFAIECYIPGLKDRCREI